MLHFATVLVMLIGRPKHQIELIGLIRDDGV